MLGKWILSFLMEAGKMPMQLFQSTYSSVFRWREHQKINWGWSLKMIPHYGMKERRILKLFWKPDHFQGFCVETFGGFCGEISTQCITSAIEDRPPSWYSNCKDSMVSTVIINRWHQDSPKKKNCSQEISVFSSIENIHHVLFWHCFEITPSSETKGKKPTTLSFYRLIFFPFTHLPYRPMIDYKKMCFETLGVAPYQ